MKIEITIKKVKLLYKNVYRCGYCDLQYIFRNVQPTYYNAGVYGWNCDIYTDYKRDIAITTGYRNMAGTCIPFELIKKYSDRAKEMIRDSVATPWDEVQNALERNREAFLDELMKI